MAEQHVKNIQHLITMLKKIDGDIAKNAEQGMVKPVAQMFARKARKEVPVRTGNLKKSITAKKLKHRGDKAKMPRYVVTLRRTRKADGWYAHFVEFGTKAHDIWASGVRPGRRKRRDSGAMVLGREGIFGTHVRHKGSRARPFFRPAFDKNWRNADDVMAKGLDKIIKKAAAGAKK